MRFLPILILLISTVLTPTYAMADKKAASKAFAEGTNKFEQGEYSAAADLFRRAYDEQPTWKIFYNIAQCEAAAKNYGQAMEAFERYLAEGGDDIPMERRVDAESEIDRLRRLVGFLEVTAPEGAEIFVDGEKRGTAPLPGKLLVAAGIIHTLVVLYDGDELLNRKVNVSGTQSLAIAAELPEEPKADTVAAVDPNTNVPPEQTSTDEPTPPNSDAAQSAPPRRSPLVPIGITGITLGGLTMLGGAATGILTVVKNNSLNNDCADNGCSTDYDTEKGKIEDLAKKTNILLITGGSVVAVSTVLLIVGKRKSKAPKQSALAPVFDRQTAGFMFTRSF